MPDLDKLDSAICELEEQASSLKEFGEVYAEIAALKENLMATVEQLKESSRQLSETDERIRGSFQQTEQRNDAFHKEFSVVVAARLSEIMSEVCGGIEQIGGKVEDIHRDSKTFQEELGGKVEDIHSDNRAFQRELDSTLVSRLDRHLSDIQVEIRNASVQLQSSMEASLKDEVGRVARMLDILLVVSITVGLGLAVGLYLK